MSYTRNMRTADFVTRDTIDTYIKFQYHSSFVRFNIICYLCHLEKVADHRHRCWSFDSISFQYLIRSVTKPEGIKSKKAGGGGGGGGGGDLSPILCISHPSFNFE